MNFDEYKKGTFVIVSGPSGCGKSSLLTQLFKQIDNYYFSISTTTRSKREGEVDGVDYHFISQDEFKKDIEDNYFLEYANVHGNFYGTSLKPIKEALKQSKIVIFDIDVQGFDILIEKYPHLVTSIFITTPSLEELENRLRNRKTETDDTIKQRLINAKKELKYIDKYDHIITNDNLAKASKELLEIFQDIAKPSTTKELV